MLRWLFPLLVLGGHKASQNCSAFHGYYTLEACARMRVACIFGIFGRKRQPEYLTVYPLQLLFGSFFLVVGGDNRLLETAVDSRDAKHLKHPITRGGVSLDSSCKCIQYGARHESGSCTAGFRICLLTFENSRLVYRLGSFIVFNAGEVIPENVIGD